MNRFFRLVAVLARDTAGATAIYVGLAIPVLLGAGALSLDLGRVMILHTELQNAADAAALAAARELDRSSGAQARAISAAQTLITNSQKFADSEGNVSITTISFFSSLNPDTLATSDLDSHYVRVETELYSTTNMFIRMVGGPGVSDANATATAGNHQTACQVAPLMMCSGGFGTLERGQMVKLTYNNWSGGAFGLLDPPGSNTSGANEVMKLLAGSGIQGCFYTSGVSVRTGEAVGKVEQGLNVRFDMFPTGANTDKIDGAVPAPVVIKGQSLKVSGGNCKFDSEAAYKALPRDHCQRDGTNCQTGTNYVGKNDWQDEADAYWAVNHPGKAVKPTNSSGISYGQKGFTRYDLYSWESLPGNAPDGAENPSPQCGPAQGVTSVGDIDRRVIYVAMLDCTQISQKASLVPTAYARFFLTEPAVGGEIMAEFIDIATPQNSNNKVHDIIQLYR